MPLALILPDAVIGALNVIEFPWALNTAKPLANPWGANVRSPADRVNVSCPSSLPFVLVNIGISPAIGPSSWNTKFDWLPILRLSKLPVDPIIVPLELISADDVISLDMSSPVGLASYSNSPPA